ncbi:MAG: hypothetical protein ACPHY8_02955 [Patescibacteria group bacterium]
MVKNITSSHQIFPIILESKLELYEFKNNIEDIETAYISLTNKK